MILLLAATFSAATIPLVPRSAPMPFRVAKLSASTPRRVSIRRGRKPAAPENLGGSIDRRPFQPAVPRALAELAPLGKFSVARLTSPCSKTAGEAEKQLVGSALRARFSRGDDPLRPEPVRAAGVALDKSEFARRVSTSSRLEIESDRCAATCTEG